MSDPRDDLAALIRRAGQDARDADHAAGYRCGFDPDRFIADAILARWRLVPVEEPLRHDYHGANGQNPCARCAADELTCHDQDAGHYGVVYESRKGALLGPGSGITTAEQARAVSDALRGRRTDQHGPDEA